MRSDPSRQFRASDSTPRRPSRREVLGWGGVLAAQLWSGSIAAGRPPSGATTMIEKPWGRIDKLAEGVWSVVSTPFRSDDWTTICNGGIVAGAEMVLQIEAFGRNEGSRAVAEIARELTGRWPTDVVVTHFHGDHTGGFAGLVVGDKPPRVWTTAKTRELVLAEDEARELPQAETRAAMLDSARIVSPKTIAELDLGGRRVTLRPRSGHTPSDLTVTAADGGVIFAGDLVWNGFVPNYRDASPTQLSRTVADLREEQPEIFVPGHGPLADRQAFDLYSAVVEDLGAAARRAIERGIPPEEAATAYRLPDAATDWVLFNPAFIETAIGAWFEELGRPGR